MPERDHSRRVSKTIFVGGMCGNGIVEAGEQCDDGNQANGDGCGDGCFLEQCGNGIVEAGEQCDDGNNRNGDGCTNICRKQFEPTGPNEVILIVLGIVALSAGFFFVRKKVL